VSFRSVYDARDFIEVALRSRAPDAPLPHTAFFIELEKGGLLCRKQYFIFSIALKQRVSAIIRDIAGRAASFMAGEHIVFRQI